ncbi:MAG: ATP phosphoribosyltransferase [Propionibacteriaceae bacterium]|jgi:ATP phosphoribosyltransferase|nr:ATP phosphoribosyltransferase [Propionibacteriaceae bacterium]
MSENVLKIAVPNKGILADAAAEFLREAGYRQRSDSKELVLFDAENAIEFYYLRPRDIAVYVGEGTLDLGITGRDMLIDSGADAQEIMALGFGSSRFRFAVPVGSGLNVANLSGKRIATAYPGLLRCYLADHVCDARVIKLDGAVESAVRLGVADAIADVVDTGTTLRKAGLELVGDPLLVSEAILIRRLGSVVDEVAFRQLQARLSGVMVARDYVLIDYDIPEFLVAQAAELTPGIEAPTVSPITRSGWVAVRALVPRVQQHQLMDSLYELGARGILITELSACRL